MGLSENEVYPITIHHAYFGGTMKPWHWHVLHTCGVLPQSPSFTCDSHGYRGTVVKTTPGSHMKSLRFKTYTVSNQKQLQAVSEAKYFWTVPIPYDPPKFAVVFAQWNPPRRTIHVIFGFFGTFDSQRFEKKDPRPADLFPFGRWFDCVISSSVPGISLDYKPVQWNWEEVKIQWWNCAKYERWCTMM